MSLPIIFPGIDARLMCLYLLEQPLLSSWTQKQQLEVFSSRLELPQCSSTCGISTGIAQSALQQVSVVSSLIKCTWSVDLKLFNFSNCSEPSQDTLESIFRIHRQEGPSRLSAETSCVSLTCDSYFYIIFQDQSLTKAKHKARQKILQQAPCPSISLQERERNPWRQLTSLQTKCIVSCRRWNPPPSLCQCDTGKPHLHLG